MNRRQFLALGPAAFLAPAAPKPSGALEWGPAPVGQALARVARGLPITIRRQPAAEWTFTSMGIDLAALPDVTTIAEFVRQPDGSWRCVSTKTMSGRKPKC